MANQPKENKAAGAPAENKTAAQPEPKKAPAESYEERLRKGRHFDPTFPHPYGRQLPDLGEVTTEDAQG